MAKQVTLQVTLTLTLTGPGADTPETDEALSAALDDLELGPLYVTGANGVEREVAVSVAAVRLEP